MCHIVAVISCKVKVATWREYHVEYFIQKSYIQNKVKTLMIDVAVEFMAKLLKGTVFNRYLEFQQGLVQIMPTLATTDHLDCKQW